MKMNRRTFIKVAAAVGAGLVAVRYFKWTQPVKADKAWSSDPVEGSANVKIVRSYCLMCQGHCGIQAKVNTATGELLKLDGNPFSPNCNVTDAQGFPYSTAGANAALSDIPGADTGATLGTLCAKGQAGIKHLYDPYRIVHPLKRAGPRGSNRWIKVTWDQAFNEIVNGGTLFAGEGSVTGLKDIYGSADLDAGDTDYGAESSTGAPAGFGTKSNRLVYMVGRQQQGEFTTRWLYDGFGSVNYIDHTSICESSAKVASKFFFGKDHLKPDHNRATCLMYWGANPLEANFTFQTMARRLMNFKEKGGKLIVVDPRFTNTAAKADYWLPVQPGKDTALAFAFLNYIITNSKHKTDYLSRPNTNAATAGSYKNWTDMTWLVRDDNGKFVLGQDLSTPLTTGKKVVLVSGVPKEQDDATLTTADLDFSGTVGGVACKTVFRLLKDRVTAKTALQWAADAGINDGTLFNTVAALITDPAQKFAADFYKGPTQHSFGVDGGRAIILLNILLDRVDRAGGWTPGGGGFSTTQPAYNGTKATPKGARMDRSSSAKGGASWPANCTPNPAVTPTRPWYPFADWGVQQDSIAAIQRGYPYKTKAMFMYFWNGAYTVNYPQPIEKTLADRSAVPLLVAIDLWVNETNVYADYILPEVTYLERWSVGGTPPTVKTKVTHIRQPVVGTLNVDKSYTPINPDTRTVEDMFIQLAKKLKAAGATTFDGFGANGMGSGKNLDYAWQFYNEWLSTGDFGQGLDPAQEYMKMGGKFGKPSEETDPADANWMKSRHGALIQCYHEKLVTTMNTFRGATVPYGSGLPNVGDELDAKGNSLDTIDTGYTLRLITHKPPQHTQSRTASNVWLMRAQPENWVEINAADAAGLGIQNGDMVRVSSPSYADGKIMKAKVSQHIMRGVVDVPNSFGHWILGVNPGYIDGQKMKGADWAAAGYQCTHLMRMDEALKDAGVTDLVGGGAMQYNSKVKVEKVV